MKKYILFFKLSKIHTHGFKTENNPNVMKPLYNQNFLYYKLLTKTFLTHYTDKLSCNVWV